MNLKVCLLCLYIYTYYVIIFINFNFRIHIVIMQLLRRPEMQIPLRKLFSR